MTKATKKTLERHHYKGELTVDGENFPVGFYASAGQDCRIVITIDPIPSSLYVKILSGDDNKEGKPARTVSLTGQSTHGYSLKSDAVAIIGHRFTGNQKGTQFRITVQADTADVTVPLTLTQPTAMRFMLRSFKSFRNPQIDTPLGMLHVQGNTRVNHVDDVSGAITLIAPPDTSMEDWFDKADAFLEHMQQGVTFAHGGRLQCARLDRWFNQTTTSTYYSGEGHRAELASQFSLNHGPIIHALVDRYFQQPPISNHIWIALGWMQVETSFDEIRFLTGMTALESILEHVLKGQKGTIVPKPTFTPLKEQLTEIVQKCPDIMSDVKTVFIGGIATLNRKTLAHKIDQLFDHYGISRRDLDKSTIARMIKLRNEIVHRGAFPPDVDPWEYTILVREIITRIILTEIGFKGRYRCYIGGGHDRDFPDVGPT